MIRSTPPQARDRSRPGFAACDIPLESSEMNVSVITLTGRYPESGFARNRDSKMRVHIVSGSVTLCCEDEEAELSAGWTVDVPSGAVYRWLPRGVVTLAVISWPPWTVEQHENIAG